MGLLVAAENGNDSMEMTMMFRTNRLQKDSTHNCWTTTMKKPRTTTKKTLTGKDLWAIIGNIMMANVIA